MLIIYLNLLLIFMFLKLIIDRNWGLSFFIQYYGLGVLYILIWKNFHMFSPEGFYLLDLTLLLNLQLLMFWFMINVHLFFMFLLVFYRSYMFFNVFHLSIGVIFLQFILEKHRLESVLDHMFSSMGQIEFANLRPFMSIL